MLLALFLACPAPPTAPVATIFPPEPTTVDELQANTSTPSTDPNGDPVSYRYAWFVDGASSGHTGATVPASDTAKGQVWKVNIIPSDGTEEGPTGYSSEVTILNSAPELTLDVADALSTEDLVADLVTQDADGDELVTTVSWTVDGEDAGIDELTVPASATTSGETWTVSVVVADDETSSEASASVVVGNSTPQLLEVLLGPEGATVENSLELSLDSSDADGDSLEAQVRWFVAGTELAEDGTTLGSDHFARGDEVYALVTVTDGFADSDEVESNHLVVENAPPPAPSVSISPEDPHQDLDDLVCSWSADEVDADGESLELSVSWDVDGEAYESPTTTWYTGDTIPAGVALEGEVWTCTAILSDGEAEASASASVDLLFACSNAGAFDETDDVGFEGSPQAQIADVDSDGHLDVLLCGSNKLEIHWGDGAGGFDAVSSPPFGASEHCPAAGDFDGDGLDDLVWVEDDDDVVKWALGDGLRSFSTLRSTSHEGDAWRPTLVDADLDGRMDLLYVSEDQGCLALRLAGGGGALDAASCLISQTGPFRSADLDGDGYEEVVQIAEGDLKIYGFDSSGTGSLSSYAVLDSPGIEELEDLDLADVDADGDLDVLAWGDDGSGQRLLARYLNDGSGTASTFRECQVAVLDAAPEAGGDLDEDGLPDLVTVEDCDDCSSTWTVQLLQ